MKSVMISIQPKWCELIATGKKTVEVRKTKPKLQAPFKVYIYCTKDKKGWFHFGKTVRLDGKVIGEFVCDNITPFDVPYPAYQKELDKAILEQSCLTYYQLHRYAYHDKLYGWHISSLVIYDDPKELYEFHKCGALSMEELDEQLCQYCSRTDYGEHRASSTPNGYWSCEGSWCDEAYTEYLESEYLLTRPPQSWCYVEGE